VIEPTATGQVGCGTDEPTAGPDGGTCAGSVTNLEAADGISGIIDGTRTQFLVGVFLTGLAGRAAAEPRRRARPARRRGLARTRARTDVLPRRRRDHDHPGRRH
jgi:hypothetical protein